jgi:uncharacterized membrane protein (DUF373 family)
MEMLAKYFEKVIIFSLSLMMMIVILLSTVEFAYILISDIIEPPIFLLEIDELLDIFGFFLLILIGVELFETIRSYLSEHVVHVEVVVEVALIAIARKVIILDIKEVTAASLVGIATIITALAIAYFVVLYLRRLKDSQQQRPTQEQASISTTEK